MSNKKNLVIFGDSWCLGAWSTADGKNIPDGDDYFSQRFKNYFSTVENYANGGDSNSNTIHHLTQYLQKTDSSKASIILVVQTEPLRSLISCSVGLGTRKNLSPYTHIFNSVPYKHFIETTTELFYFSLNELGRIYKRTIYVSGGCSDVDLNMISKYPFLKTCCVSFYSLVDKDYVPSIFSGTHDVSKSIKTYRIDNDYVLKASLAKTELTDRNRGDFFGYGNDNHPARKGIDIWIEHIYKNIRSIDK